MYSLISLITLHESAKHNYDSIMLHPDSQCGCFCCLKKFKASEVKEFTHDYVNTEVGKRLVGHTAICPMCEIDSVLCSIDVPDLSYDMFKQMQDYWFNA